MLAGQERVRLVPAWPDMLNTLNIDNIDMHTTIAYRLDIYSWLTWGPLRAWRGGLTWWPGTGRAPGPAPGPPPAPATLTPGTFVRLSEGTALSWHPGHHRAIASKWKMEILQNPFLMWTHFQLFCLILHQPSLVNRSFKLLLHFCITYNDRQIWKCLSVCSVRDNS